jgi:hypothetical protein
VWDFDLLPTLFIYSVFLFCFLGALTRPHIGVIGYYGFFLLQPEWNWRWIFSPGQGFQKYLAIATLIGILIAKRRIGGSPRVVNYAVFCLVGFIALALLSYQYSIRPIETFSYIDGLWKVVLMATIGVYLLDTKAKLSAFIWVLVIAQGFNAYRINESYFQTGVSLFSSTGYGYNGDNNMYSILTVPIIAMSASLALWTTKIWQKGLAGGIFVLQLHQIMLLESRGCMLGCLVMLPLIVLMMPKSLENIWIVVGFTIIGAVLAGPPVVKEFMSSFGQGEFRDSSAESRFQLWRAGFEITANYPILGVGPWAGQYLVPSYLGSSGGNKSLHNLFFEISCGCGVLATLLYFAFFGISASCATRMKLTATDSHDYDALCCAKNAVLPGLVGYMVSSMFSAGALLESSYALAVVGLSATRINFQKANQEHMESVFDPLNEVGTVEE